ncbi:MAG: glycosyltransferase family 2 protein [Chloroherpetonaceae bacterium]|nr:glycosyltransferase family 2 protein [Chloroherpetonaceae bacterium]
MEDILIIGTFILYGFCLLIISFYVIGQLTLAHFAYKSRYENRNLKKDLDFQNHESIPFVTVQLPLFNERYVVERLIDSVIQFDYPLSRFEIQILDDSTDDTTEFIRRKLQHISIPGLQISHIHRTDRTGFKAGALQEGLKVAKGDLIAIFDADFVPSADFLKNVVPHFTENNVGMVQARWEHLNRDYSLLTELQAFGLDAHFLVEQTARNTAGFYINFNGTAGIWRRSCIDDAGGWDSDTLTEDLDLSYRAQMKGWKFKFVEDVYVPAELPADMNAYKAQQFRWSKGAIETAKKHFLTVWNSTLPFYLKWQSSLHLTACITYLCILLSGILTVPLMFIKNNYDGFDAVFILLSVFSPGIIFTLIFFSASVTNPFAHRNFTISQFSRLFFSYMAFSMGMAVHNTFAIIQGFMGKKSSFVRTPKFGLQQAGDSMNKKTYRPNKIAWSTIVELVLVVYFTFGAAVALDYEELSLLPFQILFASGFLMASFFSLRDMKWDMPETLQVLKNSILKSLVNSGILSETQRKS